MPKKASRKSLLTLFVIGVCFYVLNNFQRVCLPGSIFNVLQTDLDATASQITALGSTFLCVYAFTQLVAGLMVDKYGGTRVIAAGAIIFTIPAILFPMAHTLPTLYVCRGLMALGGGMFYLAVIDTIRELYPHTYPTVLGITIFIGFLGGACGGLPFAAATQRLGWRKTLMAIGIVTSLLTCAYHALACTTPKRPVPDTPLSLKPYREALANKHNLYVFMTWCPVFAVYYALPTVLGPKFLQDFAGMGHARAASCSTAMLLAAAIMNVITGILCQKFPGQKRNFLILTCGVMLAGLLTVLAGLLTGAPGYLFYVTFVVMSATSGFSPVTNVFIQAINPSRLSGTTLGLMNACTYALVSTCGKIAGGLLDAFRNQATITEQAVIYPRQAYLTIIALFTGIATLSFLFAVMALPNTKNYRIAP